MNNISIELARLDIKVRDYLNILKYTDLISQSNINE